MTIEFLNGKGEVMRAMPCMPCMTFAGKYVTVSVMMGMLRHYIQTEGFAGFRFRNGNVRSSAIMVF